MSTNCVRCVVNERTGLTDLLCDECRDKERLMPTMVSKCCGAPICEGYSGKSRTVCCSKCDRECVGVTAPETKEGE